MTISHLARSAGIPVSTVRFYERRGLIKPESRTRSNYRIYSEKTLHKLQFLRAAQASGFSLKDIRSMLSLTHSDDPPCAEIASLIENRLNDVRQRVRELKRVDRMLTAALKSCCNDERDWCNQIERLKGKSSCKAPGSKCSCGCP